MDETHDLWTVIRDVLPDAEELATEVAADLGEPLDDVRLSVLIGTIAIHGQLGPEAAATAAIKVELGRLESETGEWRQGRLISVDSLDDLLAAARVLELEGSLDLETIVAIQRTSGVIAARTNRAMVSLLHRYQVTRRLMWEQCVTAFEAARLDAGRLAQFGRFLLLWNELTSLAVTDGYRAAEREILARDVEARRSALQELLGPATADPASTARLIRSAVRQGLNVDHRYLLIAIEPRSQEDSDRNSAVTGGDDLDVLAGRIGHLLGSAAPGAEGAGIRLPAVLPLMGSVVVLALDGWAGISRVPTVLDSVLGHAEWVAVAAREVEGVGALADSYADLVAAVHTAQRIGVSGWIPDSQVLALERLLLVDPHLADATVRRELGPVLADERFGAELIETLQAYFDAGENVAAAARSLHLATRTVAYRLEKVESLIGHQLDAEQRRRLSAALLVYRLHSAGRAS